MSTAEVTAYLFGVDYAKTAPVIRIPFFEEEHDETPAMSDDTAAAMFKLGRETFWHWALRGAIDGVNER